MDLTEAKDIKKRWQEYMEELYKKDLHDPANHDGVITHLEPEILEGEVTQSCSILCDPVDCNLLGFCVHGILQARILEWIPISFSRGIFLTQGSNSCLPVSPALQADSLPLSHLGNPLWWVEACKGEVAASEWWS